MEVVVILGGNLGDTLTHFNEVIMHFENLDYKIHRKSSIYRSKAWGYTSSNDYYNQVLVFNSNDSPIEILQNCLSIEKKIGRIRKKNESYSDRPIDIDILYLDDQVIEEDELQIPHPRLQLRKFTLLPLVEIMPDFIHPILKIDHKSLLLLCPDLGKVEVIN